MIEKHFDVHASKRNGRAFIEMKETSETDRVDDKLDTYANIRKEIKQ
jgi:hypothetical protein